MDQMKIGKFIATCRKNKKLTQEQLAEKVGIDPKSIRRIELGSNYPTPETLSAVASALNVEVYELFVFNNISYDKMKEEIINALDSEKNILRLYRYLKFEE